MKCETHLLYTRWRPLQHWFRGGSRQSHTCRRRAAWPLGSGASAACTSCGRCGMVGCGRGNPSFVYPSVCVRQEGIQYMWSFFITLCRDHSVLTEIVATCTQVPPQMPIVELQAVPPPPTSCTITMGARGFSSPWIWPQNERNFNWCDYLYSDSYGRDRLLPRTSATSVSMVETDFSPQCKSIAMPCEFSYLRIKMFNTCISPLA